MDEEKHQQLLNLQSKQLQPLICLLPSSIEPVYNISVQQVDNSNQLVIDSMLSTKCEQCDKRFNKKSHLYRHIRQKHEQHRQFECTYKECNKKFKRGSHLKRHMISHSHEKKYKCFQCIMEFGYKHHLDRHIKIVHQKELFKCQQCESLFSKKKGLAKHVNQHKKVQFKTNTNASNVECIAKQQIIEKKCTTNQNKQYEQKNLLNLNNKISKQRMVYLRKQQDDDDLFDDFYSHPEIKQQSQERNNDENADINTIVQTPKNVQSYELQGVKELQTTMSKQQQQQKQQQFKEKAIKNEKTLKIVKKSKQKQKKQVVIYRCTHSECLRAYKNKYALKNHIKNIHQLIVSF